MYSIPLSLRLYYAAHALQRVFFATFKAKTSEQSTLKPIPLSPNGSTPIKEATQEDKLEFTKLFDAHYKPLLVYAKRLTNDLDSARELVQVAFCVYWEKRHTILKSESVSFFLSRTIKNAFIDETRKAKRQRLNNDNVLHHLNKVGQPENENSLEAETTVAYTLNLLDSVIKALKPKYQSIIRLHFLENLSLEEISHKLNLPYKTVFSRRARAIEQMRQYFNKVSDKPNW